MSFLLMPLTGCDHARTACIVNVPFVVLNSAKKPSGPAWPSGRS